MGLTKQEILQRYINEDQYWSEEILLNWLVQKKHIDKEIAYLAVEKAILDIIDGLDMPTHHIGKIEGCLGFDNYVLTIAQSMMLDIQNMTKKYVEGHIDKIIEERMKNAGRIKKIWKVIKGEI